MKAVKEGSIGNDGVIAVLKMSKFPLPQHQLPLEEQLKHLKEKLVDIVKELNMDEEEFKLIPVRVTPDKLVLILPESTPEFAGVIAERLQCASDQYFLVNGLQGPSMTTEVTAYSKKDKQLTPFLRLLFKQFLPRKSAPNRWGEVKRLLSALASHVAEGYLLLDQAQNLALSDDVSGLPNHRAAQTVLGEKFEHSSREQAPFSILFIDGDISYQKGNSMIRNLGEILTSQLRRGDFLARWFSGDEFLVVLPGADRREAFQVGERLRVLVETTTKSWLFPITISVGMASFPEDGATLEDLLRKAEEANAIAKRAGKNLVCEASGVYDKDSPVYTNKGQTSLRSKVKAESLA
jgi:diguanylate cyclase (GGDEF)-like protein